MGSLHVGVDIGGTFTDFTLTDVQTGARHHAKRPTTPARPADAVVNGLEEVLREKGYVPSDVERFVHGQTIALNTVLQRRGERLGLVVTRGFRDILELRRLHLGKPVDLFAVRPEPLIPRSRVVEVGERRSADGGIDRPLDADELLEQVARMREAHDLDHVVVAFMHAHAHPEHEQQAKDVLTRRWPELHVSCSHEVWPEIREYERTVAAVINSYVASAVESYLADLRTRLLDLGVTAQCLVTKSNGGVTGLDDASTNAIQTMLSGPASGIAAVREVLADLGQESGLTLDMGGTSTDLAVIRDGEPVTSRDGEVGDFPVVLPAIEIFSIGAGGGSIARIDDTGVLKVGPESAGAQPGPACYGKGGTRPTLTDAYLVSGFMGAADIAGGTMSLDEQASRAALEPLAKELDVSIEVVAQQIVEVATSSLYRGASSVIARSGIEPKQSVLVAFGGAGPVQAVSLAAELQIPRVIVPASPGTLCATGAIMARPRADFIRTLNLMLDDIAPERFVEAAAQMREQAAAWLERNGFDTGTVDVDLQLAADMRYARQSYEIEVMLPEEVEASPADTLRAVFEKSYAQRFGMTSPDQIVELVSLRLFATVDLPGREADPQQDVPDAATGDSGTRMILQGRIPVEARVVTPAHLRAGVSVAGPAVVALPDSTIVVDTGSTAQMDERGNVIVEVESHVS
ncbi:hydantoinase/oxoprolinase family protein [Aeromicrobium sp. YIM 150415]|uniref:hydantoinase/oxoprolinase family protein n=1 Tax=Aeromicrobium sp. YIM 150415 TaxID=2803912 RepID=UPI00196270B8|nr:hydantoinase/oxoprolinase family protein [Aeromicrobium sp. YIM 150415]MBM9463620.1 hydantoinase/oxoprolinase family protein [Aeromicrobium sp. YIM 150415]